MASLKAHLAVEMTGSNRQEPWEACRLGKRLTPSPGPSEVLVRVLCTPVNPANVFALQGLYPTWLPKEGIEGISVIVWKLSWSFGQRVIPLSDNADQTGQGLWQEFKVVPATRVISVPDFIPNEVAAQFIVNPWTVIGIFRTLATPKEEYILQTAAASVLGRMFIQYAHHQGVKTINLVRRNEHIEELKAHGADEVINFNDGDVVAKVRKITGGRMAYGAIDCVGGELTKGWRDCLIYGALAGTDLKAGILDLIFRGVKLEGFHMGMWISSFSTEQFQELVAHAMSLLGQKVIEPLVGQKFRFQDFKDAIKEESGTEPQHGGKVRLVSE
ncbi:hypothetical protein KP509_14G069500 [Ceratopteris richardii]|uniref:Enoyl reductase (ER) domain-containing protein n=1 Tax=Ceratopteris richardii TaxID=49495 RepID=A0A8T2TCX8_CERRI|nr:hypothetical protein KP509_14G069500 [Ceratopteris richardii]